MQLGEALEDLLARSGLLVKAHEALVALIWPEVVGEWYAKHTAVMRVEGGVVTVHCDSAPRAQQLQLDAPEVISRLNAKLGARIVRDLRATSGGWTSGPAVQEQDGGAQVCEQEISKWPLSPAQQAAIERIAAGVKDEKLRPRFREVLCRAYKMHSWQLAHGWHPCALCGRLVEPEEELCVYCNPGRQPAQGSDEKVYDLQPARRSRYKKGGR